MKTTIFTLLILSTLGVFAQPEPPKQDVLVNKKGVAILPVQGNWGIGISASPFLEYAGNIFTDAYNPAPVFSSARPGYLYGKYYYRTDLALRATLGIGITNHTEKVENVINNEEYDKYTVSAFDFALSVGFEKYKGFGTRLRGFYGAEIGFEKNPYYGFWNETGDYGYGKFSYKNIEDDGDSYAYKGGNTYTVGVNGFIGIEYFFAPKLSVSSEFGVVLYGASTGKRKYVPNDGSDENVIDAGGSEFGIRTNTTSLINLNFYF